jgi:NADH-quinone oxidoreductase subunit E
MGDSLGPIASDGLVEQMPEAKAQLDEFLSGLGLEKEGEKNRRLLIPVLRKAQDLFGYLAESVQLYVANALKLHLAEVYGVVSFYSYFTTIPQGKYKISVCAGTACHVKGSAAVYDNLCSHLGLEDGECTTEDMLFTVEKVSCVGACGLAPVMLINEDVHGQVTPDAAIKIINDILKKENS